MPRGRIHMVLAFECRRPVDEAIASELVHFALHVPGHTGLRNFGSGFLIVAIDHPMAILSVEVWIMHGNLCKVGISGTAE